MLRTAALTLSLSASLVSCQYLPKGPTAKVKNGTLLGVHSDVYNQDFFLGVPYAQPPVGSLRYRAPVGLNQSWFDAKPATANSAEVYNQNDHIQWLS
jgi:acetylcholinesterase